MTTYKARQRKRFVEVRRTIEPIPEHNGGMQQRTQLLGRLLGALILGALTLAILAKVVL